MVLVSVYGVFVLIAIMETSRGFLEEPNTSCHIIQLDAGYPKEMEAETKGM